MSDEPMVIERNAVPYAAIGRRLPMTELATVLPPLVSAVADWLGQGGEAPAGPPFWRYRVIDMERELEIEVGFPTAQALRPEGEIETGELPAGRYVMLRHTGHPDELMHATSNLLDWAAQQDLAFDRRAGDDGDAWACRLEIYHTDPADEPDLSRWVTELAFKLAD